MRYPSGDYPTSIWRTPNTSNNQQQQQMHSQLKSNSGTNENPFSKMNDLSRSSTRISSAADSDTR